MTQQEFEERVHRRLSAEEYAAVEREYMKLPDELDISKDQFCRLWIEARFGDVRRSVANHLALALHNENKLLREEVKFYKKMARDMRPKAAKECGA